MNFYGTDVKGIFNSDFLSQLMLSFDVPFGGPSCTVPTPDLKFLLFSLWDFCVGRYPSRRDKSFQSNGRMLREKPFNSNLELCILTTENIFCESPCPIDSVTNTIKLNMP